MLCPVTLQVCEQLATLCGETHLLGIPCALVRCSGCELRCAWCDTVHAQDPSRGVARTQRELIAWVEQTGLALVLLTGGEPLLQPELPELAATLARTHRVLVETSGAYELRPLAPPVLRSMDLKCPGSGEEERNLWSNLDELRAGDAVKLVLTGREDYEYARRLIRTRTLPSGVEVLLSPANPFLAPGQLARWMLEDRLAHARLNLQAHRTAWPDVEFQ